MFDRPLNNVIDNVNQRLNNNVIDNVKPNVKRSATQTDAIADNIMRKLGASNDYREFYCKIAWSLSEAVIAKNLEIALGSNRSPQRYFTWLCKRYM